MNDIADPVEAVAATEAVSVLPVGASVRAPRGARSRVRWLIALAVTVLVLGLAGGATLLLTASAGDAAVLAWVPADSTTYAELRLDLPGSQRTEVPKLLAAFPGFADQAAFPAKLGEAFDRLIKSASGNKHDYQTEIAPWFGGELAVAGGPVAVPTAGATPSDIASTARILGLARVTDGAKAEAWLSGLLTQAGATTATESYSGVTLTIVHAPAAASGDAKITMPDGAYAVLGSVLVAGDTASVRAAVDTRGSRGLGTVAAFREAASAVAGDRVAFAWADAKALLEAASGASGAAKDTMLTALLGVVRNGAPAWTAGAIRAVDGNLVIDTVEPKPVTSAQAPATGSDTAQLAKLVPADTLVLLGAPSPGAALSQLRTRLVADPALAPVVAQVDQALGVVGGFDAATGWIGDTGIAITNTNGKPAAGLVIVPADAAGGKRLLTQLRSIAQIAGAAANVNPAFDDAVYGDATVTVVDIPNAGNLLRLLQGASGAACGVTCRVAAPADTHVTFAYSVTPQVIVIGSDARFVKAVLDARSGSSLATQPRFKDLLAKAGASASGLAWVDVAAIRDLVAAALPASARASYDADVKPFLAHIDGLVAARTTGGDLIRSTIILSIKP